MNEGALSEITVRKMGRKNDNYKYTYNSVVGETERENKILTEERCGGGTSKFTFPSLARSILMERP